MHGITHLPAPTHRHAHASERLHHSHRARMLKAKNDNGRWRRGCTTIVWRIHHQSQRARCAPRIDRHPQLGSGLTHGRSAATAQLKPFTFPPNRNRAVVSCSIGLCTRAPEYRDRHLPIHRHRLAQGLDTLNLVQRLCREVRLATVRARPERNVFNHQQRWPATKATGDFSKLHARTTTRSAAQLRRGRQ